MREISAKMTKKDNKWQNKSAFSQAHPHIRCRHLKFSFKPVCHTSSSITTLHLQQKMSDEQDKAPRSGISNVLWILSSDTICQLNKLFSNSEAAMLSTMTVS